MRLHLEHQIKGMKNLYTQSNQIKEVGKLIDFITVYRLVPCSTSALVIYMTIPAHVPTADHWIQLDNEPSTLIALFYHIQSLES